MRIETNLPPDTHSIEYVKNSHFIRLTDEHGNSTKLIAMSLRQGKCDSCNIAIFVETNQGNPMCPSCHQPMKWTWGKVQLCFIPEQESDFKPPPQKGD